MTDEFDVDSFINDVQQEAGSSVYVPVPEGDDYSGYVKSGSVKVEKVEFKDGNTGMRFKALVVLDDQRARDATGLAEPQVKYEFLLDLTPAGKIAVGTNKNTRVFKMLEANGANKPGWKLADVEGAKGTFRVKHRLDKDDPEIKYPEIKGFAPAN